MAVIENTSIFTFSQRLKPYKLRDCLRENVQVWKPGSKALVLFGLIGQSKEKRDDKTQDYRTSFEKVISDINNQNSTAKEKKIIIVSEDISTTLKEVNIKERLALPSSASFPTVKDDFTLDEDKIVSKIKEHDPDILILAFDFSSTNKLNTHLRAVGVYANLMVQADLQDIQGKVIKSDLLQKQMIKEFVDKNPQNVLVAGLPGTGQNLFLSQLMSIKASHLERNNISFRIMIIHDLDNMGFSGKNSMLLSYMKHQYFEYITTEINERRKKNGNEQIDVSFTTLCNMLSKHKVGPQTFKDWHVKNIVKKLVAKGNILDKDGWLLCEEYGAPSIDLALLGSFFGIPEEFEQKDLLQQVNDQSDFKGKLTPDQLIDWLIQELKKQIVPTSDNDVVSYLRQVRQKWLLHLFWKELHGSQNSNCISIKLEKLLPKIAKEQPNVYTIVMLVGFQLDYGAASWKRKEPQNLIWNPKSPKNVHLLVGVDPMSWQNFEIPTSPKNSNSMFFFLKDQYRNTAANDAFIKEIGLLSDYEAPLAYKEMVNISHSRMHEGIKPSWLKVDCLKKDHKVLSKALREMTSDYSKNVCWTCCCSLGFKQSISLCKEIGFDNWKYIPCMELEESATDCLVIFDLPIGNSKIVIHKTLAKLFTAAKKSVIIVTDEETKKRSHFGFKILLQAIDRARMTGFLGVDADEMISVINKQESRLHEKEFYVNSKENRRKVIDYIRNSPNEKWMWTKSEPSGMRAFSRHGDILAAVLQRLKDFVKKDLLMKAIRISRFNLDVPDAKVVGRENIIFQAPKTRLLLDSISSQFDEDGKSILDKLSKKPWTNDQILSIFDMLQYVNPNGSEFKEEGTKQMIKFIKKSVDRDWEWVKINPRGILYFANHPSVLAALLQRLKFDNSIEMTTMIWHLDKENNTVVNQLAKDPWNEDQLVSIMDMLQLGSKSDSIYFNQEAKHKVINFIQKLDIEQCHWIEKTPDAITFFSSDIDILVTLINKIQFLPFLHYLEFHQSTTVLHLLSQAPLNELQMDLVMNFLGKGAEPNHKNIDGKTFLDLSPIKARLSQRIETAPDDWCSSIFEVFGKRPEFLEGWINLGSDKILSGLFKRLTAYSESSGLRLENVEPISFAKSMWREKPKLPNSFNAFLIWTANYHHKDYKIVKMVCNENLRYSEQSKDKQDDLALPFFLAIKEYLFKEPTLGYYVKKLFTSFTIISLMFRCIDGVTDFTLTFSYFNDWESFLQEYLEQTLCTTLQSCFDNSTQTCNHTCLLKLCEDDLKNKPACSIPNLKLNWIPGMFSVIILLLTWLTEVITIIIQMKRGCKHYINYCETFSGACCKKHRALLVYAAGFLLPLTQQVSSFIYEHWLNTFVLYWKDKPKQLMQSKAMSNPSLLASKHKMCTKCSKCQNSKLHVCVHCSRNAEDFEKLDELKDHANKVADHSRTLIASTENLLMPMIQLSFLFPSILMLFNTKAGNTESLYEVEKIKSVLNYYLAHKTILLIMFSITSSLVSLAGSQTAIYFANPRKRNQKTLTTRIFIFFCILLQVLPKILAFQLFSFGLVGTKWQNPDAMFFVLFFMPIFSSIWKVTVIWITFCHNLTWKMVCQLLLSPFIFTRIAKTNQENNKNDIKRQRREKKSAFITDNGKYHITFDVLSFIENCSMTIIGGHFIAEAESSFKNWIFFAAVSGTHLLGLLLKCLYYQHQHPWMSLSEAHKSMGKVLNVLLIILGFLIIAAMPVSVTLFDLNSTYSSLLYTIFGLSLLMVSWKIINLCARNNQPEQGGMLKLKDMNDNAQDDFLTDRPINFA